KSGASVIYQATFFQPPYLGRADFLVRVNKKSKLGEWSYEAVDTKLARSTKASALLQLCFYSEHIERTTGEPPDEMHVELGGGEGRETFRVNDFSAYYRKVKADFEAQAPKATLQSTYPEPVERCAVCDWYSVCDKRWHDDDHLSLVAGISRTQRQALPTVGVDTMKKLGRLSLPLTPKVDELSPAPLARVREQARIQVEGRDKKTLLYELIDEVEDGKGLEALPEPSPGDVFFDIEADPYADTIGLEYLLGYVTVDARAPEYTPIWALDRDEEKQAFERFVDFIEARRKEHPAMHVYHYAAYETGAVKRLAGRHNTRVEEVDTWMRAGLFVDLYQVVKRALRASVESYSIKKIEALYGFVRTVDLRDANASLAAFETWLALGGDRKQDRALLDPIAGYNEDDCVSTLRLRDWLEERRKEREAQLGRSLARPELQDGKASEEKAERDAEMQALFDALTKDISADAAARSAAENAKWVLAQLLEFHRREEKSLWWEFFRMKDLDPVELIEDNVTLGGLVYEGIVGTVDRSFVHRYRFPPQDHGFKVEVENRDPATGKSAGTIVAIDEDNGVIELKRGKKSQVPHPVGLFPFKKVSAGPLVASIKRLGEWVRDHDVDSRGFSRATRDLLMRRPPRLAAGATIDPLPKELPVDQAIRVGLALNGGVLPIQGPPGAGKTYTGTQMVLACVKKKLRVGVTANSHRVIVNFLEALADEAKGQGAKIRIHQKAAEGEESSRDSVVQLGNTSGGAIAQMLEDGEIDVVGGTAWLFSDPAMRERVDVLFVDEAGQLSLANTVAAAQGAKNLVLLGDPQQLNQPTKGIHPDGVGVSALGHVLGEQSTLSADQGLFLAETRRMHPNVCTFISEAFYASRLDAHASTHKQRLDGAGPLGGTGLRFVPVQHEGNRSESEEEAAAVKRLLSQLTRNGATWVNEKGKTKPLTLADVLIVTPYNAQLGRLSETLPAGAQIGTVDKFQGKEAAVVIYTMASSTPADAPRGMEFLYSPNRLNVAISRAKCVAILVASPALFDVECKSPRQMQLVNAFCRYLERSVLLVG
ncbi:MAG: TM0106 family RecB-like putative nuclease, partial [Deltaproteobacteria bacterium]|nr:TM0106 family RecB-like putative nuclease [Deltaproteobacteria bacterium]